MEKYFLSTKLFIPPHRGDVIQRKALLRRLDDGWKLGCRLFIVSAPAGFGKTSLVSEWISELLNEDSGNRKKLQICWLSLDPEENQAIRFWEYIVIALQTINAEIGCVALSILHQSGNILPLEPALISIINDLVHIQQPILIVLDDYHSIEDEKIHASVAYFIEHLPPNVKVVITTRVDPPMSLARWRVRSQLFELRAADLRFSLEEISQYLNQLKGLGLAEDELQKLEDRTEGWAAGLHLLALSLQGSHDVQSSISAFTGSNRYVLDYLVEEVLNNQTEDVRQFLIHTSILNRMTYRLCDVVTGRQDSKEMLERFEQQNLFLLPLDTERIWYRYHHLFAEFLRNRLYSLKGISEKEVCESFRRASIWCQNEGLLIEAIEYLIKAKDFDEAASLMEQMNYANYVPGEANAVLQLLSELPQEIILVHPHICLSYAWVLFASGKREDAERYLQRAERAARGEDDLVHAEAAAMRAIIAMLRNDIQTAERYARRALELLPEDALFLRALVGFNLGMANEMNGELEKANQAYHDSYEIGRKTNNQFWMLVSGCQMGDLQATQGDLRLAEELYGKVISDIGESVKQMPIVGMLNISYGWLMYEWNNLDRAAHFFIQCIEFGKQWETIDILLTGLIALAHVNSIRGDWDCVDSLMSQAEIVMQGSLLSEPTVIVIRASAAKLYLKKKDVMNLEKWVAEFKTHPEIPLPWRDVETAVYVRILILQGKFENALFELERSLRSSKDSKRIGNWIEFMLLKALVYYEMNNVNKACEYLAEALSQAERGGYVRLFLDGGEPVFNLLKRLQRQEYPGDSYRGKLLGAFRNEIGFQQWIQNDVAFNSEMIVPLSEREIQVLTLILEGLSNQEIAERLVVAVSTVKTHINNIFDKMGVQNRTQAVIRAKELRLI